MSLWFLVVPCSALMNLILSNVVGLADNRLQGFEVEMYRILTHYY